MKSEIRGEVVLDKDGANYGTYKYNACQMYIDDSYVLNVYGGASSSIKQQVKQHVEDLHGVVVTTITRG